MCDGFVGNAVLKAAESLASSIMGILREELMKHVRTRLGAWLEVGTLFQTHRASLLQNLIYEETKKIKKTKFIFDRDFAGRYSRWAVR